jgi:hypothetical protein
MRKLNQKNIFYIKIFSVFILVVLSSFIHNAYAATTWIYWSDTPATENGQTANSGWTTKDACEIIRNNTASNGHTTSDSCYQALPAVIKGFTPVSGKAGDYITISGQNFTGAIQVLFGTISAAVFPQANGLIRTQIPQGATAGKLTVVTQYHGSAVSSSTFTPVATAPSNLLWWYMNAQQQFKGGTVTETECVTTHSVYNTNNGIINGTTECSQQTQATVNQSNQLEPSPTPTTTAVTKSTYTLLEPLPCDNKMPNCVNGKITSFDPAQTNSLSSYLNIIIRILIGVAAVLAMIMIVMGGIEYMTSGLVSSKEAGKKRITDALVGLLIVLVSYLILFTINPNLLKTIDPSNDSEFAGTTLEYQEAPPTAADFDPPSYTPPSGAIGSCSQGQVQVTIPNNPSLYACGSISAKVQGLIDAAWAAGIRLSGWGYRSHARQIQLRKQNCGTTDYDIYQKPSKECKPHTAIPGTSRHESGLAVDLRCNGGQILNHSNSCFVWLQVNAKSFGLYNYAPEPWHWSDTGS